MNLCWLKQETPSSELRILYFAYWDRPLEAGGSCLGEHRGLGDAKTLRNDVFDHPKVSRTPPDPSRDISQCPSS